MRGRLCSRLLLLCWLLLHLAGCASWQAASEGESSRRPFDWERDVFVYPNQLFWEYDFDEETGLQVGYPRDEPVEFGQRCMVMARGVRQFYRVARFAPDLPRVSNVAYRELIRQVFSSDLRDPSPRHRIIIPGYADLHGFSSDREQLLKSETPGAWHSYLQRGNWRMLWPFSPRQERGTAKDLLAVLERNQLAVVRLVRFPNVTINHAVLIFAAEENRREVRFQAYDPNLIEAPLTLVFDRATGRFELPPRNYFIGGPVSVYQAYHGLWF